MRDVARTVWQPQSGDRCEDTYALADCNYNPPMSLPAPGREHTQPRDCESEPSPSYAPLSLTFLGSGTSAGVPMIGCHCDVCTSTDPRDTRHRASAIVRYGDAKRPGTGNDGRTILIDTTPELRLAAIANGVDRVDAIMLTHAHADHVTGLDDLRRFNAVQQQPLDLYGEQPVLEQVGRMFEHIFNSKANLNRSFVATLCPLPIEPGEYPEHGLDMFGARWTPLRLMHGRLPILGYRIDLHGRSIAYCTDVSTIPESTWPSLAGVEVLVIDGLRHRHHPTHLTVERACQCVRRANARLGLLTHIAHDLGHAATEAELPDDIRLAYDGLTITLRPGSDAIEQSG